MIFRALGTIPPFGPWLTLREFREFICFKFAKKALRLEQFKKMFPVQKNLHGMVKRNTKKYKENLARTE